jgi:hypothetical protein
VAVTHTYPVTMGNTYCESAIVCTCCSGCMFLGVAWELLPQTGLAVANEAAIALSPFFIIPLSPPTYGQQLANCA